MRRYQEDAMARETGTKPSQAYYEFLPPRLGGTGAYRHGPIHANPGGCAHGKEGITAA